MDDLLAWLRLQFTPGLAGTALIRIMTHYQTPQAAIEAAPTC
ncbi:MAG: hypothetical protein P8Y91_07375 [Desulfuromonadales bacterium]|jgi:hypothetical protein